jgi:acyl carrier protein
VNIQEIKQIILSALEVINQERSEVERFTATGDTGLFGADGVLDSLELVSLIVDVETAVADVTGNQISLTDDRAMNQPEYPFGSVSLLTRYIEKLLSED